MVIEHKNKFQHYLKIEGQEDKMTNIKFVDEQHEQNYKKMIEIYPTALVSTEYQAACYVAATPLVFYKFEDQLSEFSSPVDWIIYWQNKYSSQGEDEKDEDYQERINIEVDVNYDLTSSMKQLGKLALNLWNGYDEFNLMHCLTVLDDKHFLVIKQAIDIRMGFHK